jgi:hypothetical protein
VPTSCIAALWLSAREWEVQEKPCLDDEVETDITTLGLISLIRDLNGDISVLHAHSAIGLGVEEGFTVNIVLNFFSVMRKGFLRSGRSGRT